MAQRDSCSALWGENPLVCFGINPSTAVPNALDPTLKRVRRFAAENGYDSWTMLNVYPQIATNPKTLTARTAQNSRSRTSFRSIG